MQNVADRFRDVFLEEAMEKAAELETGLLELENRPDDALLVDSLFRAAHTVKGSSGTMGFEQVATYTHGMEEILELVRQRTITVSGSVITLLLDATDMLKEMLVELKGGQDIRMDTLQPLIDRMKHFITAVGSGEPETVSGDKDAGRGRGANAPSGSAGSHNRFAVTFAPKKGLIERGICPTMLLADLTAMGRILDSTFHTGNIPTLDELDPIEMYVSWDILLETDADENDLRDVFIFAEDDADITIRRAADVSEEPLSQKELDDALAGVARPQPTPRREQPASTSIRVQLSRLDELMNLVGEMVISHAMLAEITASSADARAEAVLAQVERIGRELQESVMELRMMPVGDVFTRFTRLVRELSASTGKKIDLVVTGEDTELDKGMLEKLSDPLVHLVRNAIDHGIETVAERERAGKPAEGLLRLSAEQTGDAVRIVIRDDGAGISVDRVRQKAVERGLLKENDTISDSDAFDMIFRPGFSTAEAVTDISGRGVGMDAVKRSIEALNGTVQLTSVKGRGTTVTITLPLTLAIVDGLVIRAAGRTLIVPLTSVVESLRPAPEQLVTVHGSGMGIDVRGEVVPVVDLASRIGAGGPAVSPQEGITVLVSRAGQMFALAADEIVGQQQVVIKHLGSSLPKIPGIAGGAILGDGDVALVLDVSGLAPGASGNNQSGGAPARRSTV